MFTRLLRKLGFLWGKDKEAVFDALEFAHGALVDATFCEDGVNGIAGQRVLDLIEIELVKHQRTFTSYIVDDDVPVT